MSKQSILKRCSVSFLCFAMAIVAAIVPSEAVAAGNGKIVVANRVSGTISVIDARKDRVVETVQLPGGDNAPEPMYVVNTPKKNRVWVSDRGNNPMT